MIKLHLKLTWPALILLLFALLVWLARDPGPRPTRSMPRRSSTRPAPRGPIIIEQSPADNYAAETERLDHEAAESGRRTFDEQQEKLDAFKERMNQRNAQRNQHARR